MPQTTTRLILAPAMLIAGLGAAACGAVSPTAPAPAPMAAELGAGNFTLMIYGTATCLSGTGGSSGTGSVPSSISIDVILDAGETSGTWRISIPEHTLSGEVGLANGAVEGYVRGNAIATSVRFSTGDMPDSTVAFTGPASTDGYQGALLGGTPRYEGIGTASGSFTTCMSNGFTLKRA